MTTINKIDSESQPGIENSLNLFALPVTSIAFNKSVVRELQPITALDSQGPYTFRVFSDNQFYDLSRTYLYMETKIEKKTFAGGWIPITYIGSDAHVSVANNFGNSFIKRLDIRINGTEVFSSGNNYAYRAYINHELFSSDQTRRTLSEATCYYIDSNENKSEDTYYLNEGFKARARRFTLGQTCYTMAKLDFDLLEQENLLINNVDILFTIWRQDDNWLIVAPDYGAGVNLPGMQENGNTYRIHVVAMKLYVVVVDVVQSLQNAIARQMEQQPAKYSVRKIEVRNFYLGPGRQDLVYNCFQSVVPRRVIVGFVNRKAFIGDKKLSPFFFDNANVRSISVEAGGATFPAVPYDFDFGQNKYIRGFVDLYQHLNLIGRTHSINLTLPRFHSGWTFYCFNLTSTLKDSSAFELIRNSTTVIKVVFNAAIEDPGYELIVFGEFDQIISISHDRVLSTDGSI